MANSFREFQPFQPIKMKSKTKQLFGALFSREFLSYFIFTFIGLLIDLALFTVLNTGTSLPVWIANEISSYTAVTFVFITVSRYSFSKKGFSWLSYLMYIIYISLSILVFSWSIDFLVQHIKLLPLLCKSVVLPISFLVNYYFTRLIIQKSHNFVY